VDLQSAGQATFDGDVNAISDITLVTGGGLTLSSSSALNANGQIRVASGADMVISGAIDAQGAFTAVAQGALSQGFTGTISAQSVSLNALGGLLTAGGNTSIAGNYVAYGLTGVTQGTTGVVVASDVIINTPGAIALNQIAVTGFVDVQAGTGGITQTPTSVVSAGRHVNFFAAQSVHLARVSGTTVTILSQNGSILDANDGSIPDNMNVVASGDATLFAFGDVGMPPNPIEIQVAGNAFVGTQAGFGPATLALAGSTGNGGIFLIGAPTGTLILFNGQFVLQGDSPDGTINWFRYGREYDVWNTDVVGDGDTTERKVMLRFKAAPRRPRANLK
jgi:hypothetical protein